jgi:hypothetical protein
MVMLLFLWSLHFVIVKKSVTPQTMTWVWMRDDRVEVLHILNSPLDEAGCSVSLSTHRIEGWVGPSAGLNVMANKESRQRRKSNRCSPACSWPRSPVWKAKFLFQTISWIETAGVRKWKLYWTSRYSVTQLPNRWKLNLLSSSEGRAFINKSVQWMAKGLVTEVRFRSGWDILTTASKQVLISAQSHIEWIRSAPYPEENEQEC